MEVIVTNCMQLNPTLEATSHEATQAFPSILEKLKVLYCVLKESFSGPYPELEVASPYDPILFFKDPS
jgi:hypothetical protein